MDFELTRPPADFIDDPYRHYAALRERDPVHRFADGGVFLSKYEDAVAVYRSPAASSDKRVEFRPKFGDSPLYEHHTTSLVFNDPPLHTRVRRLIMGAVNQRAIARMEAQVTRLVDALLDDMARKGKVDFIADFAAQIPIEVIGNLLDIPKPERSPLRDWSIAILSGLEPKLTPEMHERGNRAVSEFVGYLRELMGGERLTENELHHQCIFLLNAGHETTTNLIGNGLWALLQNPSQLAALRAELSLVSSAVEEMLRYDGPIQLNNRRLIAPMQIGGRTFPEGTLITIGIGAANRDPAQFPDPDRFDVGRKPNRHVAFGHGDHVCVGMNVARMEGRLAFSRLLARFSKIEPCEMPERDRRIRFRGFRNLPLRLKV
jgi:cytochrome P450